MNTGELLVSLSGLSSGSALTHLQAITTGTGTGETIYAPRMTVTTSESLLRVVQRAKRDVQPKELNAPLKKPRGVDKCAYVMTPTTEVVTITAAYRVQTMHRQSGATITTTSESVL